MHHCLASSFTHLLVRVGGWGERGVGQCQDLPLSYDFSSLVLVVDHFFNCMSYFNKVKGESIDDVLLHDGMISMR